MKKYLLLLFTLTTWFQYSVAQEMWSIGKHKRLALAPNGYKQFIAHDFGFENNYFFVGHSIDSIDFPYVLPGPVDTWGGTWGTAGWRTNQVNILFTNKYYSPDYTCNLHIALRDYAKKFLPLLKVSINDHDEYIQLTAKGYEVAQQPHPKMTEPDVDTAALQGDLSKATPRTLTIPVAKGIMKPGGNRVIITVLQGSWILFDYVNMNGVNAIPAEKPGQLFIEQVKPAGYELTANGKRFQPLLVKCHHLSQTPKLTVLLDGNPIFSETVEQGTYQFEVMMPAVTKPSNSHYTILENEKLIATGAITRTPQPVQTLADYVDTRMGTAHSRWMIAPGPWMPFSMVKMSPDNQSNGWQSGYDPIFESIGTFSHIHEWTVGGLGIFASNGPLKTNIGKDISLKKVNDHRIEGTSHQYSSVWGRSADQDYTLHFVIEFDQPIQHIGGWVNGQVQMADSFVASNPTDAGLFVQFNAKKHPVVQVRSAISLVSLTNANENLQKELVQPFGWNFNAVRDQQRNTWNDLFNRVTITSTNRLEKVRFYNALYRSMCGRNTWSDVNGEWKSTDGKTQTTGGKHVALGGDAFWNTFWNLNQLWNLVTPEWSSNWAQSQLAMYKANGWLAKGPAAMNYIPVMVAEHEIPQIVSAWQMGIRDFDGRQALEAAVKMQTTPGQKVFQGYAGNSDLETYLQHHYVPHDKGRFSNSMEYSFDDWTVGQLARSLGDTATYSKFNERGYWWQNVIDSAGYCHLKDSNGKWTDNFDPFKSGANKQYVEGNAWQLTFFVPQDVPALINHIGNNKFTNRLQWGFQQSEPWRFNGMNDQYWDYPVVQGNQQSMHFAFLFNWAGKPWLTQHWSRAVLDRFYGYTTNDAYLGDEDQGQLSAWLVMAAIGLFQTDGGCNANPVYEIGSPLFTQTTINLGNRYGRGKQFTIVAHNASRTNQYIQKATLNGKVLNNFRFAASELLKGGSLELEMGPTPNEHWGLDTNERKN